jgi:hypothetical protein
MNIERDKDKETNMDNDTDMDKDTDVDMGTRKPKIHNNLLGR